jgi:uncharacterized protein YndB with AHSA1/START domain
MLKIIGIVAAAVVAGVIVVLLLAARKPDTFQIRRTATIVAPPDKIYPLIADFRRWPEWSAYETKDPDMKRTYGGAASGKGATYSWDGDSNIGAGSMEITQADAPQRVALKLDFTRPFEAHNTVDFTLVPQGDATVVTWDMRGPTPFFAKIIHVFLNMDRMVGGDMESSFARLKAAAEARP